MIVWSQTEAIGVLQVSEQRCYRMEQLWTISKELWTASVPNQIVPVLKIDKTWYPKRNECSKLDANPHRTIGRIFLLPDGRGIYAGGYYLRDNSAP